MYIYVPICMFGTCARYEMHKVEFTTFFVRLGLNIGEIHFHICGFNGIDVFNKASQLAIV